MNEETQTNQEAPEEARAEEPKVEEAKAEEKKVEEAKINETIRSEVERLQREIKSRDLIIDQRDKTLREYIASHKQAKEEFDKAKERIQRDLASQLEFAKNKFLVGLLDVLDNLDRSISAPVPEEPRGKALHDGVKMVREQFMQKLKENGVTRMEVVGQHFDAERHEGISTMAASDPSKDNVVAYEARAGYLINDKILRVAQVVVFKN
jgi:molecular chaperone GrpE